MRPEAIATRATSRAVLVAIGAAPDRVVLVRSQPGGGAALVAAEIGRTNDALRTVTDLDQLDERELLELRRIARQTPMVLATEHDQPMPAVRALLDYLRPETVDVEPLALDEVRELLETTSGRPIDDVEAARVRRWTAGLIGDTLAVAQHLGTITGSAAVPDRLVGFEAAANRRRGRRGNLDRWDPWAIVTAAGASGLALHPPDPAGDVRPVDAAALVGDLSDARRRAAIDAIIELATVAVTASLDPETLVQVGTWWCEADRAGLDAAELGQLVGAVQAAFERNRLGAALPIAERLWRRTRYPLAGVALASALGRAGDDDANRELLDDLSTNASPVVVDAVTATRATWLFHHERRADEAVALLRAQFDDPDGQHEASRSTLTTLELHLGHPDEVDALLDEPPGDGQPAPGPTPFNVNALVLADLARGRHRSAIDRLDRELERRLDPGFHLSVDRDRFYRTLAAAVAGWADPTTADELDRAYQRALDAGDDWTIGWMGWGAGAHAARIGLFALAHRRLRAAALAFGRAHRPGFAMWPASLLVEIEALAEVGDPTAPTTIPFHHAVVAERARAELALAVEARGRERSAGEVAALLGQAASTARNTGEVLTAHLVAFEQLLTGLDAPLPTAAPTADGVVVEAWAAIDATRSPASIDDAGRVLIDRGWVVLGVRLRADAAQRRGRRDPRGAGRILQEVRTITTSFDAPLRPWVLADRIPDLPTLSARELEVAEAVAGGASRDEAAATLVVSRRTVDSHLQRIYAKLGITSRSELRAWLDRR